jgi:hypothetical protein
MPASLVKQSIVAILRILKQHPGMELKTKMLLTRRLEKLHVLLEQERTELLIERAQTAIDAQNDAKQLQSAISDTNQTT